MDILNMLDRMEDIIEDSSKIPLSNKVMIDKEELLDIINEIRLKLPDEINRASWIAKERQRILNEAQTEADEIIERAKREVKYLIDENEISKQAKKISNELVESAQAKAAEMKENAYNYSDEILLMLQEKIKDISIIIDQNREELKKY